MQGLVWTAVYFLISVLGYVILSRWVAGNGVVKFIFAGMLGGLGLGVHQWLGYGLFHAVSFALLYAFICELFIFFITFVQSSVAVSLLLSGAKVVEHSSRCSDPPSVGGGPRRRSKNVPLLLRESIIGRLDEDESMVKERIEKLVSTDFLEETCGGFKPTKKGLLLLRCFRAVRSFFRHEGPERTLD